MTSSSESSSQLGQHLSDDGVPLPEEFEGFNDFTLASSWERFISDIEAVCRLWMVDGPKNLVDKGAERLGHAKNLYKVKSELKYGIKSYCMEYYFEVSNRGGTDEWCAELSDLQLLFGVNDFVVIVPVSVSGVVLDAPEASKLLSSVAIALSNCGSVWPAFVPVHDPSRKAYIGIQNMGMTFTRRFDTDRIGSQVPVRLMHLEGLYELFVSKFALSATDISMRNFDVHFTMKLTYRTPPYEEYDDAHGTDISAEENTDSGVLIKTQWDDDCPWTEWYSAEDPIKGFELTAIWSNIMIGSSIQMAEVENASSFDAEKWIFGPTLFPTLNDATASVLIGFASQLQHLVSAFEICYDAKFIEDFISAENPGSDNLKSPSAIPPPSVIDRVLKDLFNDVTEVPTHSKRMRSISQAIKGAPVESLFAQFCLHALWLSDCNIRAIATLWIEFVREIRWCWEESESLPRMPTDGVIDLSACLIYQKLQMLAICIQKRCTKCDLSVHDKSEKCFLDGKEKTTYEAEGSQIRSPEKQNSFLDNFERSDVERDGNISYANPENSDHVRTGSPTIFESMMLLRSHKKMRTPLTQDTPIMTEDMHEERLHAVEAFGDSYNFSAMLERDILSSDMSAFKAANPDAIFEDFIRWHSPGDWESDEIENPKPKVNDVGAPDSKWPPRGKLSQRMSEHGNSWRHIWNDSPPLPASLQKPLFDPVREGEKVLHYLETLRPHQLLSQMVCTAFRGALDTLNQTPYGSLKQMKSKIEQLYHTTASSLKPLKGSQLPDKTELIPHLKHLCTVFGHVEKLLLFAASIHRKLLDAPRLSEAIFNSYHNYYLPKLETGSSSICYDKEFDCKNQVKLNEREHVALLFPPPTANQSWRKVLSMGNLLNGHEPIIREIIFSVNNKMGSLCYGTSTPWASTDKGETHRMYICGTSNDLQVALSVISWD